jgi:hypothetical protein
MKTMKGKKSQKKANFEQTIVRWQLALSDGDR